MYCFAGYFKDTGAYAEAEKEEVMKSHSKDTTGECWHPLVMCYAHMGGTFMHGIQIAD